MKPELATKMAEDLRNLAIFIESNPGALPSGKPEVKVSSYLHGDEANQDVFLALVKAALNSDKVDNIRKNYFDEYFEVFLSIGDIQYEVWSSRAAVCEKRVVDTITEIERVPTAWEEREVETEVVEWDCHPLLKS